MGTHRAGLSTTSDEFHVLLKKFMTPEVLDVAELFGFYAHAGHSYGVSDIINAHELLLDEITAVNEAAKMVCRLYPNINVKNLTLSVGATPTSNSLRMRDELILNEYIKTKLVASLEIHCGNYCVYDLQQLATGCINDFEVSGYVVGTVISSYNERNEMLTNTGVMALTRESSKYKGNGLCISLNDIFSKETYDVKWYVDRISQEHGILKPYKNPSSTESTVSNETFLALGQKIAVLPQHACITMGQFPFYFILNDKGKVVDLWNPFQKW